MQVNESDQSVIEMQARENKADRASLELLYDISREFSAAIDLRSVLQRILFLSMQTIGAVSGSIIVLDERERVVESAFLLSGKAVDQKTVAVIPTYEHGLAGWVGRHRQAALIHDTSQDERWLQRPDDARNRTGPKSAVSVPIQARERLVGVITLVRPKPGEFTEEHLQLVEAIAGQVGIAILNAHLFAESRRQARVMTAIAESAAVITASLDLNVVLQRILEQVIHALRVQVAALALFDPRGEQLEYCAATAGGEELVGKRLAMGEGIAGWTAYHEKSVLVDNAQHDARFRPDIDGILGEETRSIACAPIFSQSQRIGVLQVINPLDDDFNDEDLQLLNGIGRLAGTAILHAQLFERLQSAHQRYRQLFEDSIDPILITDWKGNILEANRQAELTSGLDREKLRSWEINQLFELNQEIVGRKFRNLAAGNSVSFETVLHARGGLEMPVQVNGRKVLIDGVAHLQWILRDITERKNLDTLRDELITMIYHDLRSPMSNIVSSLDVVAAMFPAEGNEAVRSLLNIAIRSTERIQRLTNSLLDLNRLEAGQPIVNLQVALPFNLIKDAVEAVTPIAMNKRQVLENLTELSAPPIRADVDMIRRVLVNLLENAIKFTPPQGIIQVGAAAEGNQVLFWVEDSGAGIPAAELENIFKKFTRLGGDEGPRGFGLGLAFCRLAVSGHSGRIWVTSDPGSGARFQFTIPQAH
jgi:PAS domain S-box-containing protein